MYKIGGVYRRRARVPGWAGFILPGYYRLIEIHHGEDPMWTFRYYGTQHTFSVSDPSHVFTRKNYGVARG